MLSHNLFVCVCDVNGNPIRDTKEDGIQIVQLPFDTEYSIRFINKESRKCLVKVEVDGQNATENGLLIEPNSDGSLEGILEGIVAKYRFKFIQKTKEIVEHRGSKPQDGTICIKFRFEEPLPEYKPSIPVLPIQKPWVKSKPWADLIYNENPIKYSYNGGQDIKSCSSSYQPTTHSLNNLITSNTLNNNTEGLTTKGSFSDQNFTYGYHRTLENNEYTITIKLVGHKNNGKKVSNIVKSRDKLVCEMCGKVNKENANYCNRCGTNLK